MYNSSRFCGSRSTAPTWDQHVALIGRSRGPGQASYKPEVGFARTCIADVSSRATCNEGVSLASPTRKPRTESYPFAGGFVSAFDDDRDYVKDHATYSDAETSDGATVSEASGGSDTSPWSSDSVSLPAWSSESAIESSSCKEVDPMFLTECGLGVTTSFRHGRSMPSDGEPLDSSTYKLAMEYGVAYVVTASAPDPVQKRASYIDMALNAVRKERVSAYDCIPNFDDKQDSPGGQSIPSALESAIASYYGANDATANGIEEQVQTAQLVVNGACNPGSMYHPELCKRPCLYFASGSCTLGRNCEFCHLPHSKRGLRLDKASRSKLQEMSFAGRAAMILPIIRDRLCGNGGQGLEVLAKLQEIIISEHPAIADAWMAVPKPSRLTSALSAHTARQLIALLKPQDECPEVHRAVDAFVETVRQF